MRQAIFVKSFRFLPWFGGAIFLAMVVSAEPSPPMDSRAECLEEKWIEGPSMNGGIFRGTLEIRCRITGAAQSTVAGLRASIENRIRRTKKVADEAKEIGEAGLPTGTFDATTVLNEGEGSSEVAIRDRIRVGSNERDHLLYRTDSLDIRAKGMGSHLKEVSFFSELRADPSGSGSFFLVMRNVTAIERPWYAAPVFFTPIAKRVTLDKFRRAREVLLSLILTRLSGREPPADG